MAYTKRYADIPRYMLTVEIRSRTCCYRGDMLRYMLLPWRQAQASISMEILKEWKNTYFNLKDTQTIANVSQIFKIKKANSLILTTMRLPLSQPCPSSPFTPTPNERSMWVDNTTFLKKIYHTQNNEIAKGWTDPIKILTSAIVQEVLHPSAHYSILPRPHECSNAQLTYQEWEMSHYLSATPGLLASPLQWAWITMWSNISSLTEVISFRPELLSKPDGMITRENMQEKKVVLMQTVSLHRVHAKYVNKLKGMMVHTRLTMWHWQVRVMMMDYIQ